MSRLVKLAVPLIAGLAMQAHADNAAKPGISSVFIQDIQSTFSINLSPNSSDFNFYIKSPAGYSYYALGIGSTMTNSLMLVAYMSADQTSITVSPRLSTGDSEPPFYPSASVQLNGGTGIQDSNFIVSGTCKRCLSWPGGSLDTNTTAQPFIYALGPDALLASNDLSVGLRRHSTYGHLTMSTTQATGPGGPTLFLSMDPTVTSGAHLGRRVPADDDKPALAHGLLMALTALVIAPVDLLAAAALRRWPLVHGITALGYGAALVAGFGLGVKISAEYLATRSLSTPHQILGFIALLWMLGMLGLGVVRAVKGRAAKKRGEEQPQGPLTVIHFWGGRLLWVLLLVNCGLGLKLAAARTMIVIGYSVLATGVFIVMLLVQLCVFCYVRRKKSKRKEQEEDSAHQLAQLYAH